MPAASRPWWPLNHRNSAQNHSEPRELGLPASSRAMSLALPSQCPDLGAAPLGDDRGLPRSSPTLRLKVNAHGRRRCTTFGGWTAASTLPKGERPSLAGSPKLTRCSFDAIDVAQHRAGIHGDILEIGCYQGASAVLLGYMAKANERLIICDLFDGATVTFEDEDGRSRFYMDLSRQSFERNYSRFHGTLPEIVAAPSSALFDEGLDQTFRLIHIDGSHAYEVVRSDLLLAKKLLMPGGVVIFDDIVSMHTPGVTAAVWEGVMSDELIPLFQSRKFYGTWGTPWRIDLPDHLPKYPHEVFGHTMLHIEDAPPPVIPPSLGDDAGDSGILVSQLEERLITSKRKVMKVFRQVESEIKNLAPHS